MGKNYTISIPVKVFWKFIVPGLFLVCLIGAIGGVFIVDRCIMPNIVGVNRDIVEVPSVKGMQFESAREKFFAVGLLTEIRSREYDDSIQMNSVVSQFPETGSKVKKGRKIAVVVSKGKEITVVPEIRGLTENQARVELRKNGLTIGKVSKVYAEKTPEGSIVNIIPQTGTTISRQIEVELFVSKGPKPTHAVVPNLVGESIGTAKKLIDESGLKVGKITYPVLLPGTVVSQSVAPGSRAKLESGVNLVVSVIRN
ncbi:MAG: PASTA domain-containing protein [Fibrobacter sp.]|nr:PASTA domain-containing protein [Fibrobacter sp.]